MLVLGRKTNEVIVIGEGPDAVRLTLLSAGRDRARIGIEAPRHVPVLRAELLLGDDDGEGKDDPPPEARAA